ncbi:MAG: hypothetical protein DWQ01_20380 [Planctomycetota bacterium]|nr:MAG: hypothetical protein DWQ01_20380 [Planctomycetota bacterium]
MKLSLTAVAVPAAILLAFSLLVTINPKLKAQQPSIQPGGTSGPAFPGHNQLSLLQLLESGSHTLTNTPNTMEDVLVIQPGADFILTHLWARDTDAVFSGAQKLDFAVLRSGGTSDGLCRLAGDPSKSLARSQWKSPGYRLRPGDTLRVQRSTTGDQTIGYSGYFVP